MVKISDLDQLLGTNLADGDQLVINDISDSTQSSAGTSKRIIRSSLFYPKFRTSSVLGVGNADPDLVTGSGILFPATQDPSNDDNTLDDYEEGTWTPTYTASSGSFTSITYDTQAADYVKIGRTVFISVRIQTDAVTLGTATGILRISGLPFTSASPQTGGVTFTFARFFDNGNVPRTGDIGANATFMNLYSLASSGADTTAIAPNVMSVGSQNNENSATGFGFYTT
jgi:hypothetical protein